MDHEQNFCPEGTYWHKGNDHWGHSCTANHFALDFANYIIWECQALAKMAEVLSLSDRVAYWTSLAANITREMDELMWDEDAGMHFDLFFNGTKMPFKTIATFYPLLIEGYNKTKVARIVQTMQTPDFWTAVPLPTVSVSTPDFSSDLDRGPMVSCATTFEMARPLFTSSSLPHYKG
jgi:neutral trehalase